jgi:hypothetical protein
VATKKVMTAAPAHGDESWRRTQWPMATPRKRRNGGTWDEHTRIDKVVLRSWCQMQTMDEESTPFHTLCLVIQRTLIVDGGVPAAFRRDLEGGGLQCVH